MPRRIKPTHFDLESKPGYLRVTPLFHVGGTIFLVLGRPRVIRYMSLPAHDPLDGLEEGLIQPEDVAAPQQGPVAASPTQVPPAPPVVNGTSAREIFTNAGWYLDKAVILVGAGAAISAARSILVYTLGAFLVMGWFSPYKNVATSTATVACIMGGTVLGAAVGLLGFLALCVRRVRMSTEERKLQDDLARFLAGSDIAVFREEPVEISDVIPYAARFGAAGMVLGMIIVPSVAVAAREAGFGCGHAAMLSGWGVTVPYIPNILGAMHGILSLDPVGGWQSGSKFWTAIDKATHDALMERGWMHP
ncbi:hypothetical protein FKP32DRAFT_1598355 [Trametes sanguinea]|nr:hypothetical protein FKP32DRAFT_1598355 [Trametes sanguinea]